MLLILSIVNCQLFTLQAQDMQILAQRDLLGSARYVGMAGAMTAVGGDPSAVNDNPAGLGVYRRWDVSLSLFLNMDRVYRAGEKKSVGANTCFSVSQASFVFGWMNQNSDKGLLFNNVMVSYHNLATYDRYYVASNRNEPYSLTQVIAAKTQGVDETALQHTKRWESENWLSNMAYDTYLINPSPSGVKRWDPIVETTDNVSKNQLTMREYGHVDQYGISWGGNISNIVYVGATLNILAIDHTQSAQYYEIFGDDCSMDNNSYVHQSGVGVNGAFGVIAHPVQWLRIGASFTTPSAVSLTTTSYGDMRSALYVYDPKTGKDEKTSFTVASPENSYVDRSWEMPLRVSGGLAFQVLNYGLVSLQYDYAHHKNMDDIHTFRAGLEGVIVDRFFLNAGYAFESSFCKNWSAGTLPSNTPRTDAYSQFNKYSHYATAGFGYHGANFTIHAAYRYRWQRGLTYAHEYANPYDWNAATHDIVLTLDFHTK